MPRVKDLKIAKNGALYSLIGGRIRVGGQLRPMKGGTIVRHGGQLYVYSEAFNAHVAVSSPQGTGIGIIFQSRPSVPFRPAGEYRIAGEVIGVQVRLAGELHFTDGSSDAWDFLAGPFVCDGAVHDAWDAASVSGGKELYRVDVSAAEIIFSSEGMDAWAYAQGEVSIEGYERRFVAAASVSPAGAGVAEAAPSDPTYGQWVRFEAEESDRDAWRFTRWASGHTSRSYAIQAFGDLSDTAVFVDASAVMDFSFTLSVDAGGHLLVVGKSLQNKTDEFVMVAFDIKYLDRLGAGQTAHYEREVFLDGRVDAYVFADTNVSEILEVSEPQFGDMPQALEVGDVQVIIRGAYASQSLDAGYSLWSLTADDDD